MRLFSPPQRKFVEGIAALTACNPFVPERIALERQILGADFDERYADWNVHAEWRDEESNVPLILERASRLLEEASRRAQTRGDDSAEDAALYDELFVFVAYHRMRPELDAIAQAAPNTATAKAQKLSRSLENDAERLLSSSGLGATIRDRLPHFFAGFFQVRRAFANIFHYIVGVSRTAARLRAAVWQSIFTHDLRRYRDTLYPRMGDFTTLITGPTGTGKELVARAIGLSRYIPYDARAGRFSEDFAGSFFPVNLSAFSPTLIESELFGHRRGAFTGAVADRAGWLEQCPALGAVFLDEIGELDPAIQVKLLRVLQSRSFSRLGETETREFRGKIIAATNRDLARELDAGRFRTDFYYRLCSDILAVPTLRQRLDDDPGELPHLVHHLVQRIVGAEAPTAAEQVCDWIERHLGPRYQWLGNIRELEQCIRNVLIRNEYRPPAPSDTPSLAVDPHAQLLADLRETRLTADELLQRYCTLVYAQTGSYEAAARILHLDRRTVKAKVLPAED